MKEVLDALTDDQAARLVAVLRQTVDKNKAAKWTILMAGKGGPIEGTYQGGLSYKEVAMGSPTRRATALIRERVSARQARDNLRGKRTSRSRSNSGGRSLSNQASIPIPGSRAADKPQGLGELGQRLPSTYDMRPDYYRTTAPQMTKRVSRSLLMSPGTTAEHCLDQGMSAEGEGER